MGVPGRDAQTKGGRRYGTEDARAYSEGGSDAHSGFGDFDDRDGFDSGTGSGPDVRSGLSGLPARVRPGGQLLRMPLHVASSVQRFGIRPRRPVRHQSII